MRTAEEVTGTVLHRLIQEQLRYGNPTDTRTLLAIQQQALRRSGGGGSSSGGGAGSSQSSLESLTQEEPQSPNMSTRQEPQGQEHQGDYQHSESYQLYHHHGEELPSYEQAKAHSQLLASQWSSSGQGLKGCSALDDGMYPCNGEERWDGKRSHARSLSERLLQLSLERNDASAINTNPSSISPSYSYPQMPVYHGNHQGYEYNFPLSHTQEYEQIHSLPPPPPLLFHPQHSRPMQSPEERHMLNSVPPAGREVRNQVELLLKENERLRLELEGHSEKALRIQKLEQEIQRISEQYETLMQGCAKREALEQTLKNKLMGEIKRLQALNSSLKESLENTSKQAAKEVETADLNQHMMIKLMVQNEEKQAECERLEREIQRLRAVEEEQQGRVKSLEEALGSAQIRSKQLQEELRRKTAYVERVERLQGALAQLQAACEKREGLELRLRTRLEQELRSLRAQQRQTQAAGSVSGSSVSVATLQEHLREREERILALEADMTRWQQKYLEESTMREFAMDAAATAAAQRDTTIIKCSPCHSTSSSFNEDQPFVDHRNQEMEHRIRALYAQILEKDAVINVLQHRLHQEQEKSGDTTTSLHPSGSEPPVNASSRSSHPVLTRTFGYGKGKRHSDDQTAFASTHSAILSATPSSQDSSSQADETLSTSAVTTEQASSTKPLHGNTQQQQPTPPCQTEDPLKGVDNVEADAVEIFI
ncbi:angiomotin-like 2b [Chanos chanos]|uniref:Angiomotin-like 2b n=1 Tax=Chanos chanos TaxID=29144 RepID=A0A6J2VF70_CHACN|nr:angiomotin-like 2a [Chanos chanos]